MTTTLTPAVASAVPMTAPHRGHPFALIADDLEQVEEILTSSLDGQRTPVAPLIDHLRHYRGKRLRPALLLLTAKACGGITPHHHTLAAVVEMIHTATLVHDDVLDEAETRRHIPTFHAEWGNKTSILFGDMLFTKAFHLSSMVDRPACELIGLATNRVCSGELRQMCERGNWSLTEEVYFDIIEGKTAALTQVCGELGARYAGSSPEIIASLGEYGRHLGIAFQIADDLLDLVGDPDTVGKTLGTDLAQGKLTLPLILTLKQEQYRQELLAEIKAAVGATVSPEQQTRIPRLLKLSGSLEQTRCVAEFHARRAVECLQVLEPSTAKTMLEQICLWSVQRER